jgi:predicted component of type VI protein secretion system
VIDERGREAVVLPGKNIVGRGAAADVAVDRRYRSVSRSHVILEVERDSVKLTDVSTHGTYLLEADVEPRAGASDRERT